MKTTSSTLRIRATVKDLLKKHGITYREFGKSIGMSEGSVKQLMSRSQFTVDRIELIAQKFGLSLIEFLEIAHRKQRGPTKITHAQEELLVENPISILLMFLLGSGFSLNEAQDRLRTDERKFQKALHILDRAGIVEMLSNKKIFVKLKAPFRFNKDGAIEKKLRPGYLDLLVLQISKKPSQEVLQRTFEMYVSEKLFLQMKVELHDFVEKYANLARIEVELNDKGKSFPITGLFLMKEFDGWGKYIRSIL